MGWGKKVDNHPLGSGGRLLLRRKREGRGQEREMGRGEDCVADSC